ncbi:MAG: prolipoprotein diacylglyceryl transferase [Phycisphaerales bacterium]|nr:prolipoprotein diacylglyceryl transferase [Phycisphaerales bacterium]
MLADAYLHQIDPFIVQFSPSFGLRWYGMAYLAGLVIAWIVLRWMARTGRCAFTPVQVTDFLFAVFAGVLIGGRLGYVVFYDPSLLVDFSGSIPYWGVLALTKGGMSSHGGIIGVIVAGWIFSRRQSIRPMHAIDLTAFAAPAGLCLGRIANFINGELWGRPLPASMQSNPPWWSVKFPQTILHWSPDQLPRLTEAVGAIGITGENWSGLLAWLQQKFTGVAWPGWGEALRTGDADVSRIHRILVELSRVAYDTTDAAHAAVVKSLAPALEARYPSQFIQAFTDGPLLACLLIFIWWKPRKPGVVGSWFLIGYGVMRIISERFREPDEGVALLLNMLTRGQVLSVLMITVGVITLTIFARRPGPLMGGLSRASRPAPE